MTRLFIISLTLFLGCKATQPTLQRLEKETEVNRQYPSWVIRKPINDSYYHGIGNASVMDPNYQQNAKAEALDDLASEISVNIESTSLLSQIENRSGFNESFRSSIKSSTNQDIEGYELEDSWSNESQYWVYYRLNKSEFHRIRSERKATVIDKAQSSFENAEEAYAQGEFVQSIQLHAQVIESLQEYLNEKNEVVIDGKPILLANESYIRLQRIISGMSFKSPTSPIRFNTTEKQKVVSIGVFIKSQVVRGLPVSIEISTNRDQKITNENGNINVSVSRLNASKSLKASLDLGLLDQYPITKSLFANFIAPSIELSFEATPPVFSIETDEKNLGVPFSQKDLSLLFSKLLTSNGAIINDESKEYTIEIEADTRKGTEVSGLYSSYLSFSYRIKDEKDQILLTRSYNEIKGMHTSYERAGLKAYQAVEEELSEEIKRSLNEEFFNNE